jgi:transposase
MIQILRDTLQQRLRQQPSFLLLLSRARLPAFGRLGLRLRLRFEIRRVSMRHSRSAICSLAMFRSKRTDRVKLLAWDGSGMVLVTKWLHQGRFIWPPIRDGVVHLSATQLAMLLDGLEWTRVSPKPVKQPSVVG